MSQYLITQGKMLSSQVGVGHKSGSTIKEMYFPDVQYEYTVNGNTYQGNRFWQEKAQINQVDKIQTAISAYPVGAQVTVYYDAQNPSDSFLQTLPESGFNRLLMVGVAIGIIFVVLIFIAVFAFVIL